MLGAGLGSTLGGELGAVLGDALTWDELGTSLGASAFPMWARLVELGPLLGEPLVTSWETHWDY
jgi:hypothetical protein